MKQKRKTNAWRQYVFWTNPFVWIMSICMSLIAMIVAPFGIMKHLEEMNEDDD